MIIIILFIAKEILNKYHLRRRWRPTYNERSEQSAHNNNEFLSNLFADNSSHKHTHTHTHNLRKGL
jgi:hypothetical protein